MTGRTSGEQPNPDGQWPPAPAGFGPPPGPGGYGTFGPPPQPWQVAPDTPATVPVPAAAPARTGGRFTDRPGSVVLAVLVAVLLAIGAGVYVTVRTDRGTPAAQDGKNPAAPSGSPSVDQGDGKGPGVGRDTYDPNGDIKPGEARVWLRDNQTEVAGAGTNQFGPWRVGEVVVKAMFKEVTAYAVADGQEKWKVALPTPLCGVPPAPSANGKLVVAVHESDSLTSHCTDLQQIDLTTGKAGWKTAVPQETKFDSTGPFTLAISGDTVAVARSTSMSGFSVTDGRKLFGTSNENGCYPSEFAGGSRLLLKRSCAGAEQVMLQEVDPVTAAPKWSHTYDKGWKLGRVLSMDPLVVAAYHSERKVWSITAFAADGKIRSQSEPAFGVPGRCNGWGSADGLQECLASTADADTLYVAGGKPGKELGIDADAANQVVAVDLNTGKEKWRTAEQSKGRSVWPLAVEGGRVVVYVSPGKVEAASVVSLAPADGSAQPLLRTPAAAAGAEGVFYNSGLQLAWAGGRMFLLNGRAYSPAPGKQSRALLSFGK
ncbi:PQQ-binding-like beta-propeller repeat protein [Streptomyces sp. NPDC051183]|uniref:outer membrane protein assembly factor BamB family protein n=1 Tax=Streptomyces sp. NPDC051183 TaxID=3155165 RepID=UPI003423B10B